MLLQVLVGCLLLSQTTGIVLDGICSRDADCELENSFCAIYSQTCGEGYCVCDPRSIRDNDTCKRPGQFESFCDNDTYCIQNTTCTPLYPSYTTCHCPETVPYDKNLKMCTNQRGYGEECTTDSDCFMGGSAMVCMVKAGTNQKTCTCSTGYRRGAGEHLYQCILPRHGEPCTSMCETTPFTVNDPSVANLICNQASLKCDCPPTHVMVTMEKDRTLHKLCIERSSTLINDGEACSNHGDCQSNYCGTCPDSEQTICQAYSKGAQLDDLCSEDTDCEPCNSYCNRFRDTCNKGSCVCKPGFVRDDNICKLVRSYKDYCDNQTHVCESGAICTVIFRNVNSCQCPDGTPWNERLQMCTTLRGLGETCTTDKDCFEGDHRTNCSSQSAGTQKTCTCRGGYFQQTGDNKYKCRTPEGGERCTQACSALIPDASVGYTSCNNTTNLCECETGHELKIVQDVGQTYKLCIEITPLTLTDGEECSSYGDCVSGVCHPCIGESTRRCQRIHNSITPSPIDNRRKCARFFKTSGGSTVHIPSFLLIVIVFIARLTWIR